MGYYDILAKLFALFPEFMTRTKFWRPGVDRNTVRVELADGKQFQFSYWNDNEWDLAAVNTSVRRI